MCWPVWLEELSLPVEQRPLLATVCYADALSSSPSLELTVAAVTGLFVTDSQGSFVCWSLRLIQMRLVWGHGDSNSTNLLIVRSRMSCSFSC